MGPTSLHQMDDELFASKKFRFNIHACGLESLFRSVQHMRTQLHVSVDPFSILLIAGQPNQLHSNEMVCVRACVGFSVCERARLFMPYEGIGIFP